MIAFKRTIHTLAALILCTTIAAQSSTLSLNNTNSPFSRYGVGILSDEGFGNSRAMGGIGYALRNGRQINPLNPASYSGVDSLTFLFDTGFSLQTSRFSDQGVSKTANNSSFDYIAFQFRVCPNLGVTAGLIPYSSVGYNLGDKKPIIENGVENTEDIATHSYYGNGGLHQVLLGLGYSPIKNLSVGFNISYLFGSISKASTVTAANMEESKQIGITNVYDYKLDLGAQYEFLLDKEKQRNLTVGAIYSLGHKLNTKSTQSINNATSDINSNLKLPNTIGLGVAYTDEYWTVGADYNLQLWKQTYIDPISANTPYASQPLCNRSRLAVGAEWIPSRYARSYLKQIRYRFGGYYTTPYYKMVNTSGKWIDGPQEFGISAGFGLPIPVLLNRSLINVSLQYVHTSAQNLLTDNTFRISIGVTFNERWFKKWKVE